MSPLLQSNITGMSVGMDLRTVTSASIPADPKISKNAEFGLKAAAYGAVFPMISRQKLTADCASEDGN